MLTQLCMEYKIYIFSALRVGTAGSSIMWSSFSISHDLSPFFILALVTTTKSKLT